MQKIVGIVSIAVLVLLAIAGISQNPAYFLGQIKEVFNNYGSVIFFSLMILTSYTAFYFSNVSMAVSGFYENWGVKFYKFVETVSLLIFIFIGGVYFNRKDDLFFTLAFLIYFGFMIAQALERYTYLEKKEGRAACHAVKPWDIVACMAMGLGTALVIFELRMPIISFGYVVFNFFALSVYVKIKK